MQTDNWEERVKRKSVSHSWQNPRSFKTKLHVNYIMKDEKKELEMAMAIMDLWEVYCNSSDVERADMMAELSNANGKNGSWNSPKNAEIIKKILEEFAEISKLNLMQYASKINNKVTEENCF